MTPRIHLLAKALSICAVGLLASGCVQERYRPATTTTLAPSDPCENLTEVRQVPPRYPADAVSVGKEGWVKLKYHVAPDGSVFNVRVVAASPEGVFERSSAEAMQHWRYAPHTYPAQNCSHVDVYRFDDVPIVLSPRNQGEFAAFTGEVMESPRASQRSSPRRSARSRAR